MGIRIWLDDIRPMPEGFDVWCCTARQAYKSIVRDNCDYISFDNDMGNPLDGYWLATCIENLAWAGKIHRFGYDVHSANPEARRNINAAMKSAIRFWDLKGL